MRYVVFTLLGIAGLLAAGLLGAPETSEERARRQSKEAAQKVAAEARSRARYESTPDQRKAWGQALRRAGWNCPEVKQIWWEPEDAKGINAKLFCGPADGTGNVFSDRIFKATMRPNGVLEARTVGLYD